MNRIPRKFKSITAHCMVGIAKGRMIITKDEYGYHGRDIETGKEWNVPIGLLRNDYVFEIENIEK